MAQVHVTLFQDPIDVPADEVEVLRAQGLLREEPQPAPDAAAPATTDPAPAAKTAPKTTKDA